MIYVFGDYALDTERYELHRGGVPLRLEPKAFDLLVHLIQQHGQCVSKEHLHEHLWPNQCVSEAALTSCIMAARKVVGDDGRVQRLIKTAYRRGYRFIAPVQERQRSDADALTDLQAEERAIAAADLVCAEEFLIPVEDQVERDISGRN